MHLRRRLLPGLPQARVDPAAAIQQTKISASVDWLKNMLTPGAHK
jgi:hypothetical protein